MEENKYSIYFTKASWTQNNLDYNNGCSFYKMYKEDPGINSVNQFAMKWIEELLSEEKYKDKNCQLIQLECKFVEQEVWCLGWFNHYTYNTHLSDSELKSSFASYIDRQLMEKGEKVCLMGAEDLWRWEGPCRCEHCTKQGITYIDH